MNRRIWGARACLSNPEVEIRTGSIREIMGLVEDELWSVEPDFGRIVALCVRRALRGKVMGFAPTRVKIADKTDMGSLTAKPEDVLVLFERYDGDPDTGIPVLVGVRVRRPYVRRCSAPW